MTALLLLGCVEPTPVEETGDPIRFGISAMVQTVPVKGLNDDTPSQSSSFLFAGSQFGVYGSYLPPSESTPQLIFNKQAVTCQEDNSQENWTYEPVRYWRKKGTYKFCAVYPANATCEYGSGPERLVIKYSMHDPLDHDLMAAKADITVDNSHPDRVPLEFNHACAAVRFLFKNGVDESTTTYKLNSFELQYLQTIGVFIYDSNHEISISDWHPAFSRAASVFEWTAENDEQRILIPATYEEYAEDHTQWYYVIPQEVKASGMFEPSVNFSVLVNDNPNPVYTTIPLVTDPVTTWQPGYLYTYCIRIQRSQVTISLMVEPWDSYKVVFDDFIFFGNED